MGVWIRLPPRSRASCGLPVTWEGLPGLRLWEEILGKLLTVVAHGGPSSCWTARPCIRAWIQPERVPMYRLPFGEPGNLGRQNQALATDWLAGRMGLASRLGLARL